MQKYELIIFTLKWFLEIFLLEAWKFVKLKVWNNSFVVPTARTGCLSFECVDIMIENLWQILLDFISIQSFCFQIFNSKSLFKSNTLRTHFSDLHSTIFWSSTGKKTLVVFNFADCFLMDNTWQLNYFNSRQ